MRPPVGRYSSRAPGLVRRSGVLVATGGPYVVNVLHELPGCLEVLLRRLQTFVQNFLKLGRRVLLEDLERVDHLHVGPQLHADVAFVELSTFLFLQCALRAVETGVGKFQLNLLEYVHVSSLPGGSLRFRHAGRSSCPRCGGFARRNGFTALGRARFSVSRPLRVPPAVSRTIFPMVAQRRDISRESLQLLGELFVIFLQRLCKFLDILVVGTRLGEFRKDNLVVVRERYLERQMRIEILSRPRLTLRRLVSYGGRRRTRRLGHCQTGQAQGNERCARHRGRYQFSADRFHDSLPFQLRCWPSGDQSHSQDTLSGTVYSSKPHPPCRPREFRRTS